MMSESMTSEMKICLQAWKDCQSACTEAMNYCADPQGQCLEMTLLCMMRDCAEMCMMCANLMSDGSEFMGRAALLCAEMCERCAMTCSQMNNPKLTELAVLCHRCAEQSKQVGTKAIAYFRRTNFVTEPTLLTSAIA
ncbi:MAG TPA: four-helix bundle copper-binding protein [Trichocoleus sp.]|jgi:hypothetical protein